MYEDIEGILVSPCLSVHYTTKIVPSFLQNYVLIKMMQLQIYFWYPEEIPLKFLSRKVKGQGHILIEVFCFQDFSSGEDSSIFGV